MIDDNPEARELLFLSASLRKLKGGTAPMEGMTHGQCSILREIHHTTRLTALRDEKENLGIRVSQLATTLNQSMPSISQRLRELENMGYIARRIDKSDRRATFVYLTENGERLAKQSLLRTEAMFRRVTQLMGPQNTTEFLRLFRQYVQCIQTARKEIYSDTQGEITPI